MVGVELSFRCCALFVFLRKQGWTITEERIYTRHVALLFHSSQLLPCKRRHIYFHSREYTRSGIKRLIMRPLDRRGLKSRACSRNFLVNGLRFFWVIAVIWCEVGIVFYSLSGCKWPDKQLMQVCWCKLRPNQEQAY